MHSGRPLLYSPQYVHGFRIALREARADLHEMHVRHLCELAGLRHEVNELRDVVQLVVSILRQQAKTDVASLRRQLEVALARLERDPAAPLN